MTEKDKSKAIEDALGQLHKKYGKESVLQLDKTIDIEVSSIPTGCFVLDDAFGCGGLPRGRIIELFGQESCLSGDTFISYAIRKSDRGKNQNHKGGTIKSLYERFHDIPRKGKGNYVRKQTIGSNFYVSSINENNAIIKNRVLNVVSTGLKECFEVMTSRGFSITCTGEHKFYIGNGYYLPLEELTIGSVVYVHNNTRLKGRAPQVRYKEVFVKYHPSSILKIVNGRTYYRVKRANIVYEANLNGYNVNAYIKLLNEKPKKELDILFTIPKNKVLHHINFDSNDDALNNLLLLGGKEHNRLHALNNGDKLNFVAVEDVIKSIKPVGKIPTYDIKCAFPYNNYVANKIIVHNSGKSTLAIFFMAQIQKQGGKAALIDAEFAFDANYARAIGLDTDQLILAQPGTLEEAMDVVDKLVKSHAVDIIVVDSVASLVPRSELEGEEMLKDTMAVQARLMGKALRILTGSIARSGTVVIFINQIREKVGVFFGKKETTPGGKALKFFSSVRIDVKKGAKIEGKEKELIGHVLKATMVKNKVGYPWKEAIFELYFGSGIDLHADALDFGEKIGLVTRTGNTYSIKELKIGVGREQAKKYLKENDDTYQKLVELIHKTVKAESEKELKVPEKEEKEKIEEKKD